MPGRPKKLRRAIPRAEPRETPEPKRKTITAGETAMRVMPPEVTAVPVLVDGFHLTVNGLLVDGEPMTKRIRRPKNITPTMKLKGNRFVPPSGGRSGRPSKPSPSRKGKPDARTKRGRKAIDVERRKTGMPDFIVCPECLKRHDILLWGWAALCSCGCVLMLRQFDKPDGWGVECVTPPK